MTDAPVHVDLDRIDPDGPSGAVWSLPHGGDLDANLVRLAAGAQISAHRNDHLDVLFVVLRGAGSLEIDGEPHPMAPHTAVLVPKGTTRAVTTDGGELVYLTVHRSRPPLDITPR